MLHLDAVAKLRSFIMHAFVFLPQRSYAVRRWSAIELSLKLEHVTLWHNLFSLLSINCAPLNLLTAAVSEEYVLIICFTQALRLFFTSLDFCAFIICVTHITHAIVGYTLPARCTRRSSCSLFCCFSAFQQRTSMTYLLIIGLLNILCFPFPSNFSSFKEAINNEASFASSFVRVTMLACQATASDPLFQWHDGICWPVLAFTR